YTQGKWYPGELLPRWAMHSHWRLDGQPIWQNPALLADPHKKLGASLANAKIFLHDLAESLAIPKDYILPAYEDIDYYLWKEQYLPIAGDVLKGDDYEIAERKKIADITAKNLGKEVGYVLPLHFSPTRKNWISNRWQFAKPGLTLITGDSPIGLRLPLASLPFVAESDNEFFHQRSPFEQKGELPSYNRLAKTTVKPSDKSFAKDPGGLIKSAIACEIRDGILHIFLPPLSLIEHFLDLVAKIENIAAKHNIAIVLEGYMPPKDLRVQHFSVTPDPGVIEVNVQPANNWQELKNIVNTVYEEAYNTALSAEKFLLDGKRVGTGGGNHIVMGAATPEDSPFLRYPHLLQSLITFWQHHPALSYLFSGMYIGPTSQSPRIDEARNDSLYELEIAFSQIPNEGEIPHWQIDRLLRNLLVDITGNTHRAEFCIDKLYSP
ncbi:MAG: transglutaminase family protein, partial [Pseudomonadota bacterium]